MDSIQPNRQTSLAKNTQTSTALLNVKFHLFFILIIFLMTSCSKESDELVLKKTSPDNKVDMLLMSDSFGATTSKSYYLYLTPHNQPTSKNNLIIIGDHFDKLEVVWLKNQFVELKYNKGRIFKYTNFWSSKDIDDNKYLVEIRLKPPDNKFSVIP